ncbi:unnamed protein product [Bursaphelenchus xylophilus]|uniref:(pine wood nematode) hypothetical protein n=1 Tax=Bursaphelenchus xylophilus TaxID=6326 RepID=A0A1I7RZ31_BURXY|nr:unnamed protein product [Bursaphelenchus xylophilus]CAG9106910.1 unnamed protein product [Bursaphelenchus xylophilus]
MLVCPIEIYMTKTEKYDPCNNYYEYACNKDAPDGDVFEEMAKQNSLKVIKVLNQGNTPNSSFWLRYSRQFWSRCLWEKRLKLLSTTRKETFNNPEEICFKEMTRRKEFWNSINRIFLDQTLPNIDDKRAEFVDDVSLITANILTALKERISSMAWISEEAQDALFAKIAAVEVITVYIDEIEEDRFIDEQFFKAHPFQTPLIIDSLAPFNYQTNGGIFPLGMLQPPIFGSEDTPETYGRLAFLIAQFLGHPINNVAIRDGDSYRVYWNYTTEFDTVFNCFKEQYHRFDGYSEKFTEENIADFIGLSAAYTAFNKEIKPQDDQIRLRKQFFRSFTKLFCSTSSTKPGYSRQTAPYLYRVMGALQNMPEFSDTFSCKEGDKYFKKDRCDLWNLKL